MSDFYCLDCAKNMNHILETNVESLNLFSSPTQLTKYAKHTNPNSPTGYTHSVFFNTTSVYYRDQVITAVNSGFLEINSQNEKNFICVSSVNNGFSIRQGKSNRFTDAFKVVQFEDPTKTHVYPINKSTISGNSCKSCGKNLFL